MESPRLAKILRISNAESQVQSVYEAPRPLVSEPKRATPTTLRRSFDLGQTVGRCNLSFWPDVPPSTQCRSIAFTEDLHADHTQPPDRARARQGASARWLANLFRLEVRDRSPFSRPGRFAVVRIGEINLDFDDVSSFEPHHYAFLVDDDAFDGILERLKSLGAGCAADPFHRKPGEINHHAGGRGFYFRDPNSHDLELLTRTGEEH